jgi:hypothetical protein
MGTDSSPAGRNRTPGPGRPVDSAAVLAERLFGDVVGALELFTVHLGDRLGFYRALDTDGHATPADGDWANERPGTAGTPVSPVVLALRPSGPSVWLP